MYSYVYVNANQFLARIYKRVLTGAGLNTFFVSNFAVHSSTGEIWEPPRLADGTKTKIEREK